MIKLEGERGNALACGYSYSYSCTESQRLSRKWEQAKPSTLTSSNEVVFFFGPGKELAAVDPSGAELSGAAERQKRQ